MVYLDASDRDFSVHGLLLNADPVVQGVLLLLALASVACWAIIFEKVILLSWLRRDLRRLDQATSAESWRTSRGLVHALLAAAEREADDGTAHGEGYTEMRDRLERAMRNALRSKLRDVEFGLSLLATVGSTAPFIGLFGTDWGIMNSFSSIAQQKDTTLATVAPGIAEALFATALGLAAAIPAVVAYNQIAVSLARATHRAGKAIAKIAKRISGPQLQFFSHEPPAASR